MRLDIFEVGASTIRRLAKRSPLHLLKTLRDETQTEDPEILFRKWTQRMLEEDGATELVLEQDSYLYAIMRYSFTNFLKQLHKSEHKYKADTLEAKVNTKQQHQARVEAVTHQVKQIVLMDLMLPNGKLLRNATFADCLSAGGWFAKISKKGKPNQIVGQVLNESDLRAALGR